MKSFIVLLTLGVLSNSTLFGQKKIFLEIAPVFQNANLQMNVNYTDWDGKTFKLDHFDYYLSDLQITHDGGIVTLIDSVFIVEPQNHTLLIGNFPINQIEKINFMIGVPKPLNTQNGAEAIDISVYPEIHPLSFQTPSMYWGWQAGYMHMIIGGYADNNGDGTLEAYFELHNLGNNNQQLVEIPNVVQSNSATNQIDVYVNCHVDRWINNIPLSTIGILHDQVGINVTVMENVLTETVFTQPAAANLESNPVKGTAYFVNNTDGIDFIWHSMINLDKIEVLDLSGKVVASNRTQEESGNWNLTAIPNGIYTLNLFDNKENPIGHYRIIH